MTTPSSPFEAAARELASLVRRVEQLETLFKVGRVPLPANTRTADRVKADSPRAAWSVKEFAATFGVNRATIYRACNRGEIAWTWIGGEKRIPNAELERLLAEAYERR